VGGGRSLTEKEAENVRAALRELVALHPTQQNLAERLGVKQQTVSAVLGGRANGGYALARKIAGALGRHVDGILGGTHKAPSLSFRELHGWKEAEETARKMFLHVPSRAFDVVGSWSGETPPASVTPLVVGSLAESWWRSVPLPVEDPPPTPAARQKRQRKS
jgi:transcriptional regulator with XRE-family HTH domain